MSPRMETPQLLWATYSSVWPPLQKKRIFCVAIALLCAQTVYLFFSLVTCSWIYFLYISFLCLSLVRIVLFTHLYILLSLLELLVNRMDYSWFRKTNLLSSTPCFSRTISLGILPDRSLKRLKSSFITCKTEILLFALLPPLRIMNTISQ